MPNTIPLTPPFQSRQARLSNILHQTGLEALALNPGPSLVYLSGLHFHLMERPVVALFTPLTKPVFILPELEAGKMADLPFPAQVYTYGEEPQTWPQAFERAFRGLGLREKSRIGIEPRRLRVLELRLMEQAAPEVSFIPAEDAVAQLRMYKDEDEISAMRMAVHIAQRALQATLPLIKKGMSEKELASELSLQLLRCGSQPDFPFLPIVSAGPNSANPHALPEERPLHPGDLLILDWGASYNGYLSDLTRTFAIGEVQPEFAHIAQVVAQANAAARAVARPGIPAKAVDEAARQVIEEAGYGPYFIHRTGHGLGLEVHEEPYIRAGNDLLLAPGMTFTVEPGIYLPGRGGVRIEDDLVITADGAESLSDLPRHLIIL